MPACQWSPEKTSKTHQHGAFQAFPQLFNCRLLEDLPYHPAGQRDQIMAQLSDHTLVDKSCLAQA